MRLHDLRDDLRGRGHAGVSGFLHQMARFSAERVEQALRHESLAALEQRARAVPLSAPLVLSPAGFDVIAELKLRSPAAGALHDGRGWRERVAEYARGGAAAVSVLTEPSRFDGSLEDLRLAAALLAPLKIPAMRKDFLVDEYQVLEARAAGAGGVLLIVRMLSRGQLAQLLDAAAEHGMFVLLEAFDQADLDAAREMQAARAVRAVRPGIARDTILLGLNCRDLQTLHVNPSRLAALAPLLRGPWPSVAESGVASPGDAQRMRQLGYGLALIGTALMSAAEPARLLREMLAAARTVQS